MQVRATMIKADDPRVVELYDAFNDVVSKWLKTSDRELAVLVAAEYLFHAKVEDFVNHCLDHKCDDNCEKSPGERH